MLTIGLSGGLNRIHESVLVLGDNDQICHDAAAVLVEDGRVVCAIEEERLNRVKHTNKLPVEAIRFCLRERGVRLDEIDQIAYYLNEGWLDAQLHRTYLARLGQSLRGANRRDPITQGITSVRRLLSEQIETALGSPVKDKLVFINHHMAHAVSVFAMSGFDDALVLAVDGTGEDNSGLVASFRGSERKSIQELAPHQSLGMLYLACIDVLGFGPFDEYKVMGLAPYGDPARFRDMTKGLYSLEPDGQYAIRWPMMRLLHMALPPRKKADPIEQIHMDFAASLQEALEAIVLHLLTHHRAASGHRNLCLAGGVAHNCTMTGKILRSGLFDQLFVHPAAHDAGAAMGAALAVQTARGVQPPKERLRHVYFGTDVGNDDAIVRALAPWKGIVETKRLARTAEDTARLLADGNVIGWVQGRSEFGPRALGNRSILADPRPAENKDRINAMVKKREAFRPFAPSVLEERARDFFEIAESAGQVADLPFMGIVVEVKQQHRALLGAITHVDGSARIQTISKNTNPRYWALANAFGEITGVPMLLNTSFNNNVEPIVDSVDDAVVCFLTTKLDHLVVGDWLVSKRADAGAVHERLCPKLPPHVRLVQETARTAAGEAKTEQSLRNSYWDHWDLPVSTGVATILLSADGTRPLSSLLAGLPAESRADVSSQIAELWGNRLVLMRPPSPAP